MRGRKTRKSAGESYRTFVKEIITLKPIALPYRDRVQFISSFAERADITIPDEEEEAKRHLRKRMGYIRAEGLYDKARLGD